MLLDKCIIEWSETDGVKIDVDKVIKGWHTGMRIIQNDMTKRVGTIREIDEFEIMEVTQKYTQRWRFRISKEDAESILFELRIHDSYVQKRYGKVYLGVG